MYNPPIVRYVNDHEMKLAEPFVYEWKNPVGEWQITIPKDYPFDGASVPRICWTLTGLLPTGVHLGAAAFHDYAYQSRGFLIEGELKQKLNGEWIVVKAVWDRKQCDDMFLQIMKEAGETPWKAWVMHKAVRWFGGKAWNN